MAEGTTVGWTILVGSTGGLDELVELCVFVGLRVALATWLEVELQVDEWGCDDELERREEYVGSALLDVGEAFDAGCSYPKYQVPQIRPGSKEPAKNVKRPGERSSPSDGQETHCGRANEPVSQER